MRAIRGRLPALRPGRRDRGGRPRRRARPGLQRRGHRGAGRSSAVPRRRRHPRRGERDRLARSRRAQASCSAPRPGPRCCAQLPRERVIAALDARHGEVVVEGWQKRTGHGVLERIAELRDAGRRLSRDLRRARGAPPGHRSGLRERNPRRSGRRRGHHRGRHHHGRGGRAARSPRLRRPGRHGALHRPAGPRRGLQRTSAQRSPGWPVADRRRRRARHGSWPVSIPTSSRCAPRWSSGQGVYHSRSRGLWVKGATSGATQELLRIDADCDRDCLRFTVRQQPPGFCHLNTRTCWGAERRPRRARPPPRRAQGRGAGRLLHRQAVRRSGAARRQAARGSGRAGRCRRRALR